MQRRPFGRRRCAFVLFSPHEPWNGKVIHQDLTPFPPGFSTRSGFLPPPRRGRVRVGVGRASNHAEFFPLPLAPSRLGELTITHNFRELRERCKGGSSG